MSKNNINKRGDVNATPYDEIPLSIYRADENIEYDFDLNKIYDLLDQEKCEEILSIFQESDIKPSESFNVAYVAGICNFYLYFNKEDPTYLEKAISLITCSLAFSDEIIKFSVEEYVNLSSFLTLSYAGLINEKEINEETFEFYESGAQLIVENLLGTIKDFREVFEATPDIAKQYFVNMAGFLSIFNNYLISIGHETDYNEEICHYAKAARQSKDPEIVEFATLILIEWTPLDEEEIVEYCLELIDHEDGFIRTEALLSLANYYLYNGDFFKTSQTLEQIPKPIDDYYLARYNFLLGRCQVLTGTQGPETLKLFTKDRELTGNDHERLELLVIPEIDSYIFELTDDEDYIEKRLKYYSHNNLYPGLFNYYLADTFFRRKEYQRCSEEIHNSWNAHESEQRFDILLFIDSILGYYDKIEQLRSTITDSSIKRKYGKHLDIIKNILEKKWPAVFELIDFVQRRVPLKDNYFVIGERLFPMLKYYPTCYFREQDYLKSLKGMVYLADGKTKKAEDIFREIIIKSKEDPIALCCMREIASSNQNYQQADKYSTMLKIAKEKQPSPEFVWYADLRNPPVKSLIYWHQIKPTSATIYPQTADQEVLGKTPLIEKSINLEARFSTADMEELEYFEKEHGIVAHSHSMLKVFKDIMRYSKLDDTVLITGETGTGKALVAKALHTIGNRKNRPFVVVNCAAIPKDIFESEVFGHKKGAFSGGTYDKAGYIETANNGFIIFDEIGDMPLDLQPKILHVLEDKKFMRVGESITRTTNARVIAATNKNLEEARKKGKFRDDLYYRLNQLNIEIPTLNERKEDIPYLAEFFYKKVLKKHNPKEYSKIKDKSLHSKFKHLAERSWKGNVRELKHYIEKAVYDNSSLSDGERVSREAECEEILIEFLRIRDKTKTARKLGIHRDTISYKINSAFLQLGDRFEFDEEKMADYLINQNQEISIQISRDKLIEIIRNSFDQVINKVSGKKSRKAYDRGDKDIAKKLFKSRTTKSQ